MVSPQLLVTAPAGIPDESVARPWQRERSSRAHRRSGRRVQRRYRGRWQDRDAVVAHATINGFIAFWVLARDIGACGRNLCAACLRSIESPR